MGYDMEMDDFHDEEEFNRKELEKLKKEILEEAKRLWITMLRIQVIYRVVWLTYIRIAHF